MGQPLIEQGGDHLVAQAALGVVAHRGHPMAGLGGYCSHGGVGRETTEQVGRSRQVCGGPLRRGGGDLGEPDRRRVRIEALDEQGSRHRQALGQRGREGGSVDAGLVGPGESRVDGGAVFLRDHGRVERRRETLDVLDEESEVPVTVRRGEGAGHPVSASSRERRKVVGMLLGARGQQPDGIGCLAERFGGEDRQLLVVNVECAQTRAVVRGVQRPPLPNGEAKVAFTI